MRILHTSDWHVGRRIRGRSRADEHRRVLDEVVQVAASEEVGLTIVAGDLFDVSSPSPEDERIVYRALLGLAEVAPVAIVAGNHDGSARLDAVKPLLELGRVRVMATPARPEEGGMAEYPDIGVKLALLPFVSQRGIVRAAEIMELDPDQHHQGYESRLRDLIAAITAGMGTDTVNVLASHLTVFGGEPGGGERESHIFGYAIPPQAFPGHLSYVALGHLHRQQRIAAPGAIWYSGSPMQLDFGERSDVKGVLIVDAEAGKPASVRPVPITSGVPLVQLEGTLEQVIAAAEGLEEAYVKVILDESSRSGLNDDVRDRIPGVVDVILRHDSVAREAAVKRAGRAPAELFADYLTARGVDDPPLLELFREIEAEVAG
jgi:exonuclease SbcD